MWRIASPSYAGRVTKKRSAQIEHDQCKSSGVLDLIFYLKTKKNLKNSVTEIFNF